MTDSNQKKRSRKSKTKKPKKPYPEFPLGSTTNGFWQKRIDGKIYYFGRWGQVINGKMVRLPEDGWKEALALYKAQIDDLKAGCEPQSVNSKELIVADLCNHFLTSKNHLLNTGEIVARTFAEYKLSCERVIRVFGRRRHVKNITASDFLQLRDDIAQTRGVVALGNEIQRVRSIFKFGYDDGLLESQPRYGQSFKKPSRKVIRKNHNQNGKKFFEAEEIQTLTNAASPQLKAMILLGVNCGFGNNDCGLLPISAIDFENALIDFPRPKTGIERRSTLWTETVQALKDAIENRPKPKSDKDEGFVFITKFGKCWAKDSPTSPIGKQFTKLLKKHEMMKAGRGFYALRHTFRTIADETRDFPAIDLIMGHSDHTMGGHYREGIANPRLQAVTDHVREWLYSGKLDHTGRKKSNVKLRIVG